eukprot:gene1481-870_t
MTSYSVIDNPENVDWGSKCCCKTTDGVFYEIPKDYFRNNATLTRRKMSLNEPFGVPLNKEHFEKFLVLLEKAALLGSVSVAEGEGRSDNENLSWMRDLDKRQVKFVRQCLDLSTWDGKNVPFYEEKLPKIKDVVWVKVTQVNDTSAVVQLMEYGQCDGTIPYTEVTRRRVRSIGKFIKVGKTEAAQVIRMDEAKGYIDLSKKQVTLSEAQACEARFRKGSDVRSIVCHVAEECGIAPQEAMKMIAYPLYRREPGKHAYNWLKELNDSKDVDGILGPLNLTPRVTDCLMECLQKTLRLRVLTLAAQVDITCTAADGVTHIRDVLLVGRDFGKGKEPEIDISVIIVGPPLYDLRIRTDLREDGLALMQRAIDAMKIAMAQRGGTLKVTKEPYVMGEEDAGQKAGDEEDEEDETD